MNHSRKLIAAFFSFSLLATPTAGANAAGFVGAGLVPARVLSKQSGQGQALPLQNYSAQDEKTQDDKKKTRQRQSDASSKKKQEPADAEVISTAEGGDAQAVPTPAAESLPGDDAAAQAPARDEAAAEEEEAVPYYSNFLTNYRLGPEDVISVNVFDQERYSKSNITVPPHGEISYYFAPDGIRVAGKTTKQVAAEITRHLAEFIIDPKVTVSLDKAMSARYGVIGDVAKPGILIITRRVSVIEALYEAGGVLPTGDKKKVILLRQQADGNLKPIPINVAAIEKGKMPNTEYMRPGDQLVVPGNRFKTINKVLGLLPVLSFARIFTGGI